MRFCLKMDIGSREYEGNTIDIQGERKMFRSFVEIEKYIIEGDFKKKVVLAGSNDPDSLNSVVMAKRKNLIRAVLVGDAAKTKQLLREMGEHEDHYDIYDEPDERNAAHVACAMIHDGKADIPMKGKVATADFMRAILDKQYGFIPERGLLCQATVLEFTKENRLLVISDCAVNIEPDYAAKKKILEGAVNLGHQLGMECPKVAVIAPVEVVNPAMQSTVDAAMLSKAGQRGQIAGCVIDGPLALDNAIDIEAAAGKNVTGEVAGNADVLIMPDLCTGNVFTKSLHYFAHLKQSGTITGASIPVVMTSRTDTPEDKYYSILVSVLQSL